LPGLLKYRAATDLEVKVCDHNEDIRQSSQRRLGVNEREINRYV
jgi:hypothetical protein